MKESGIHISYISIKCAYCPNEVLRKKGLKIARCFPCKMRLQRERHQANKDAINMKKRKQYKKEARKEADSLRLTIESKRH